MILCADDYGLNPAVTDGILNLVHSAKINSVSCLVTTDCWKKKASDLKPFLDKISAGLHLTLTDPKPESLPSRSLASLAWRAYFRRLKFKSVADEISTQMELFRDGAGRLPDYVDGHEFCHHFPVVREALLHVAERFDFRKNNIYIRVFHPGKLPFAKTGLIRFLNFLASRPSKKLRILLEEKGIAFNSRLLGFHPYFMSPEKYFDYYFSARPSHKDIFFHHPGLASDDSSDPLYKYRPRIYNFMMSAEFEKLLHRYNITLSAFRDQSSDATAVAKSHKPQVILKG